MSSQTRRAFRWPVDAMQAAGWADEALESVTGTGPCWAYNSEHDAFTSPFPIRGARRRAVPADLVERARVATERKPPRAVAPGA